MNANLCKPEAQFERKYFIFSRYYCHILYKSIAMWFTLELISTVRQANVPKSFSNCLTFQIEAKIQFDWCNDK